MNVKKVTRLEIVDHTACRECNGTGFVQTPTDTAAGQSISFKVECRNCGGSGVPGRTVIFHNPNKKVYLSLQDNGRTLKIFVKDKEVDDNGDIEE